MGSNLIAATQRTPGPWATKSQPDGTLNILSANRDTIAEVFAVKDTRLAIGEANAAFIVTACNAYEELVAALQMVEQWHTVSGLDNEWPLVMESVRAALAKVTP